MKYQCWLLNRLRLHCVIATIQCSTKDLGNWLIFPRWQGGSPIPRCRCGIRRVRIQFLRCIPDTRRRASILNEAISWIEGNAIFDDVHMRMYIYVITVLANFPDQRIFSKSRRLYLFDCKVILSTQCLSRIAIEISRFISSCSDMSRKKCQGYVIRCVVEGCRKF